MRLSTTLIYIFIIICNILIFASTNANETNEASPDADVDKEDRNQLKFNNIPSPKLSSSAYSRNTIARPITTTSATTTTPNAIVTANNFTTTTTSSTTTATSVTAITTSTTTTTTTTTHNTTATSLTPTSRRQTKVCPGVHIRNDLKSFEQLRGCNIIDGPLTIALVSNQTHPYEAKHYENITFPDLHEITEYLLFFRVQGLASLAGLFPNLAVIRGKELVSNYALIIYEMMHLQKVNLPKLSDILRGSVRIESNPNLCYVTTVNWEAISKHTFTPHFIKDNNNNPRYNECPDNCIWNHKSPDAKLQTKFCWSNQLCHEMCHNRTTEGLNLPKGPGGGCCSPQCAGGCYMDGRADQCIACRFVLQDNKCVEYCDQNLYEYKGRCISEQECISIVETIQQNQCVKNSDAQVTTNNLKAIRLADEKRGRCQVACPPGFEENSTNKNKCEPCEKGKCRKVCSPTPGKPFMVTNVNSLRELSGCSVINGSLEISMKGGKNVLHELETVFQGLEEIKGYLKITRSYPILTLGFLSRLKAINGSELDRGQYSLIIIDNPNLQELFMFNKSDSNQKQLNIWNGKLFAHLNPKLCPHRIKSLKLYASVADWDERDVSIHTNGDKEACDTTNLEAQFLHGTARAAMIRFENFANKMDDPRSLLYYLINYREVPNGTVTMFDGRDGCNSQNDVWMTSEESPIYSKVYSNKSDDYQEAAINVKPATRYALYVKTFTIHAGSTGAISDIIYFETAPDTPTIPKQIESASKSPDSVLVSWSPPSKPNGIIERYMVIIRREPEMEDYQNFGICDSFEVPFITQPITQNEPTTSFTKGKNSDVNNPNENAVLGTETCSKISSATDADTQAEVVTFQDMIIDIVYLKQPCPFNSSSARVISKRSVTNHLNEMPSVLASRDIAISSDYGSYIESKTVTSNHIKNNQSSLPIIMYDRTKTKTEANIIVDRKKPESRLSYIISGLDHFTLYTIEVVACHGDFVGKNTKPSKTYSKCSLQAITQVRTSAIHEYDRISNETIKFFSANETSSNIVTWRKPERPNGLVLGYRVRIRPSGSHTDSDYCVTLTAYNNAKGFLLPNMNPGIYHLKVGAITMYRRELWSDEIEFEIPPDYLVSPTILTLLIVFGIIALAFAVGSGTYLYQKKRHELTNGLIYASVNPDYIQYDPDEWEVDKKNLIIGNQIGTGSFGMVFKGQLITEKGALSCAIKTVPPTSTPEQRMDFLREASIMKEFDTFHVVKLMGVLSTTNPVYVIMEYMENGDLKSYLRSRRETYQQEKKTLVEGIYLMAAQIADGMAYLASKKFVHRDLAARNCMVGEDRVVKIGDFGLTRDIYSNDYYRRGTHGRLPVRWMAPESLKDNIYTSASDVWSFGIVVWEMVTFSAYPYQGLSNDEVIKRVEHGHTMARPDNCPDKLFYLMDRCWRKNARNRMTFEDIVEYLLPETEDKLYPNCFYRKKKLDGDSIPAQFQVEENHTGVESYALLSWPINRINGLTNGVDHG